MSSKKFTHPIGRLESDFFWHCHLWSPPCTDCSFNSQVWGQHSRNYNSWTTWCNTSQENPTSVENYSVISYIRLQKTFYCFSPWGHCNSCFLGSLLSQILHSDTIIMDLFYKFSCSSSLWSVGKFSSFSINTERSANSFLLCATHYCLPACCSFAPGVESIVDRQWFYKIVLLPSLRNQYQLPWCPKRSRSTDATERSGRTYNQSYIK